MYYHKTIVPHLIINPQTFDGQYVDEQTETKRISGTYLHGLCETGNGFDIFGIIGTLPPSTGIYSAKILGRTENDNDCSFFLWLCKHNRPHGLVVLTREQRAMEYARALYEKRSTVI
jgi:hypothetical protein